MVTRIQSGTLFRDSRHLKFPTEIGGNQLKLRKCLRISPMPSDLHNGQ